MSNPEYVVVMVDYSADPDDPKVAATGTFPTPSAAGTWAEAHERENLAGDHGTWAVPLDAPTGPGLLVPGTGSSLTPLQIRETDGHYAVYCAAASDCVWHRRLYKDSHQSNGQAIGSAIMHVIERHGE